MMLQDPGGHRSAIHVMRRAALIAQRSCDGQAVDDVTEAGEQYDADVLGFAPNALQFGRGVCLFLGHLLSRRWAMADGSNTTSASNTTLPATPRLPSDRLGRGFLIL